MADYINALLRQLWVVDHTPKNLFILEMKIIMGECDYGSNKR